jgi:site-specific DNA recombinase
MDRAIIYARVSTDEQAQAHSLPSQVEACRNYCASKGYVVIREVREDYTGTSATRPELVAIQEDVQLFDVLVVFSIDRFARGLAVQVLLEKEFRDAGKRIEYVVGGGDDTPEGRLTQQIQAVISEYEVQQIRRRTTRGHYARAKAGHVRPGRTAPYGYKYVSKERGGSFEIIPEEAEIIQSIFNWYTEEKIGEPQIARRLTEMRVLTKWDKHGLSRKKNRGVWGVSSVHAILNNLTYTGTWVFGRAGGKLPAVDVAIPSIIEMRQFLKVREQAKKNFVHAKRNTKNAYLLRRRITCGVCGSKYTSTCRKRDVPVYGCSGSRGRVNGKRVCARSAHAARLDNRVWDGIKRLLLDPRQVRDGWEQYRLRASEGRSEIERAMRSIGARMDELNVKRDRVVGLYADGLVPRESLDKQVAEINAELTNAGERLADLRGDENGQPTVEEIESAEAFLDKLSIGAAAVSFEDKEKIVNLLDARVVLYKDMTIKLSLSIGGVPHVMLLP